MKNANFRKSRFASLVLTVLIAAMVLSFAACGGKDEGSANAQTKSFTFEVVYADGTGESFSLESSAATVGEALLAEELIAGDAGEYGLYVKTVNGVTVEYETDGKYWAFYVNGEYGMSGVDKTELVDGASYAFKVE